MSRAITIQFQLNATDQSLAHVIDANLKDANLKAGQVNRTAVLWMQHASIQPTNKNAPERTGAFSTTTFELSAQGL